MKCARCCAVRVRYDGFVGGTRVYIINARVLTAAQGQNNLYATNWMVIEKKPTGSQRHAVGLNGECGVKSGDGALLLWYAKAWKKKLHKNNSRFRTNDSRANLLRRVRDAVFARDTVNESFYFFLVDFNFSTNVKRRAIIIDYTCSSFDVYYKVVFTINDVRVILSYCDLRTRIILKYIDDRFFFQ